MREININSEEGNAYYLIATARRLSKECGAEFADLFAEMMKGSYTDLLTVFAKRFGRLIRLRCDDTKYGLVRYFCPDCRSWVDKSEFIRREIPCHNCRSKDDVQE